MSLCSREVFRKLAEKGVVYCLGNGQRFLERAGEEKGRGEVRPKTANESRMSSVCVAMSSSSQVHRLKGAFTNKRVCAPKSYLFLSIWKSCTDKRYYLYLHISF